ncbi:DEAD/DEAH box helicase family protein [Leptospira sp. 2 VSF19]|uniref:DEAD/DEAH box helicase family protein n=1 Tax=Leptospira soteropolitanensis TaxID=2950025 RepID=A0AAW5VHI1_9LEPT|nr:DEAD/DEAH box helicase family protein [Leptospira soteropolitanensis]MCW7492531.1 DEAD/DEAH box helicase family protein [Leptospira soteropolitanensis]MCW7500579.1 DEAD/DEAH box helicase family protein [Leptospira soteropolitanensis]MCW7522751.1 DEAD/DEAH box helicase family protein [Leptospira soteropolitanensis]MCW7526607.1 DEAD/DEAH box helicase family protein [Leptospira soteropolitanensis]MCW7530549.1 DEAD/DEAH box helicase family protein [Leptospira soteropolitanensis]
MKFTLKDYQNEAVIDVLNNLRKARKRWREDAERHAFSLTAATGAGKTVMAAAVFEALFHGDDGFNFDRDPGAVVIWFSDDPSLNEQTRFRLMEASDRIRHTDLVVVENSFNRAKFDPGKIYFLNTQKLGRNSLLVRGFDGDEEEGIFPTMRPDLRSHTIWETIRNTIEDPALSLYLVLDEAHRGMGAQNGERGTIVQRLINGKGGVPGIPIVWGISATIERFNNAMAVSTGRITLPPVTVDATRVQESGLLKDTIVLDIPDEVVGDFDTVLMRRATDKLKEASDEWEKYAKQQESDEFVTPLMVLQVPNTPNSRDVAQALDVIFQRWSEVTENNVAHVFGDHTTQTFGNYSVPYIPPQRVQDDTWVRVLIAKDAISTGWDCPRAEVMISFRSATDQTYIAQLLGRMVRTPLARRIPGNDRLNSVDCLLPKFNKQTVEAVVRALREGGAENPPTGRILINPKEMKPNPAVPEEVWEKFVSLPSQTRPQRGAKPAIRLTSFAHELASDGILPGAGGIAHEAMHKLLDKFIADHATVFAEKRKSVMTVEGRTIIADMRSGGISDGTFTAEADDVVIGDAYRRTSRIISPDIARTYTLERAKRHPEAEDDMEQALIEAREDVATLHLMENLQILFDKEAKKLTEKWFRDFGSHIKKLSHDRQDAYRQIVALSTDPQDVDLARPVSRFEPTKVRETNGAETDIPTFTQHLLCDDQGLYPAELGTWEKAVLKAEQQRDGFKFWYRNPDRPSQDSLGVAYTINDDIKIVRPDFIFIAKAGEKIVVDIIDPHGFHLADALPKLQGFAQFAENHTGLFRRIEAVAETGGRLRFLDLTSADVRDAIKVATSAEALYNSSVAGDYN